MKFDIEKDNYGEIMTKEEWLECVEVGAFIPDDGVGYWGTETHYSYDFYCFNSAPTEATHVHWFNR